MIAGLFFYLQTCEGRWRECESVKLADVQIRIRPFAGLNEKLYTQTPLNGFPFLWQFQIPRL